MLLVRWIFICALFIGLVEGCATPGNLSSPTSAPSQGPAGTVSQSETGMQQISPTPVIQSNGQTSNAGGFGEYRIGPGDLLEIQVFGTGDLSRTVRVNQRGFISLPLIEQIQAAGRTDQELEKEISVLLAKDYIQNPQVSVFIKEYTSQRVTVEGEVKKRGMFPLKGQTTLMQAIALADGLDTYAKTSDVKVFRSAANGTRTTLQFDLDQIRNGGALDPFVQNDDIILVQRNDTLYNFKAVTDTIRGFVAPFIFFR